MEAPGSEGGPVDELERLDIHGPELAGHPRTFRFLTRPRIAGKGLMHSQTCA